MDRLISDDLMEESMDAIGRVIGPSVWIDSIE